MEELVKFLKDNLTIELDKEGNYVSVSLYFAGERIDSSSIWLSSENG